MIKNCINNKLKPINHTKKKTKTKYIMKTNLNKIKA